MNNRNFNILNLQTKQIKNQNTYIKKEKKSLFLPNGKFDIFAINEFVCESLQNNKNNIQNIKDELKKLEIKIQSNLDHEKEITDRIFDLKRKLRQFESMPPVEEYYKESEILISDYKKIDSNLLDGYEQILKEHHDESKKLEDIIEKHNIDPLRYLALISKEFEIERIEELIESTEEELLMMF